MQTSEPLHVLLVEDNPDDAELILRELRRGGFAPEARRVQSADELREALGGRWDVVLSDYVLPGFDGMRALQIVVEERGFALPFILVSGQIGDEVAVSLMKAGCADYVPKESLARLVPAIRRELREAEVRREKRQAQEALRFLAEASEAFATSLDLDETVRLAAKRAIPRLADWCLIDVRDEDGRVRRLGLAHVDAAKEGLLTRLAERYPAGPGAHSPAALVLESGRPIFHPVMTERDLEHYAEDSAHVDLVRQLGIASSITVPLVARDRIIGALTLAAADRTFVPADVATAEDFGRRLALAVENARLYRTARESARELELALAGEQKARALTEKGRQRAAFLARASQELARSLDFDATLGRVAQLPIPELADFCVVAVPAGKTLRIAALATADPALREGIHDVERRMPVESAGTFGSAQVIRSGEPWLVPEVADAPIEPFVATREEAATLHRSLGIRSYLSVPIASRDRIFGALALASRRTDRRYDEQDVAFASEFAQRIAAAVDNALLYRDAQEAIRVRDDFLTVASHELRTPLTALKVQIGNLARAVSDDRTAVVVAATRRQIDRLALLIENLLDVSRLARGGVELERERMDLGELAREVVHRFDEQLERAGCGIRLDAAEVVGSWDRDRLDQVLTSLLSNAIKFGAGKRIEVRVEGWGERARLEVRDHGIGIAPADAERIFDRFERAVSARHYGGLGLGLFISRQIVEAHGGTIRVESRQGEGSRFTVELPLQPEEASWDP